MKKRDCRCSSSTKGRDAKQTNNRMILGSTNGLVSYSSMVHFPKKKRKSGDPDRFLL